MKNVFLGEYVKQRRLDLGLTQEQLCYGICEPMTLSRLENGKQTPSRNRINALLQRLGLPDDRYFALLSKNELEMEALQKEIVACNVTEKVPEGFEKLAQFEKLADPDDQIAQQFALRSRENEKVIDKILQFCKEHKTTVHITTNGSFLSYYLKKFIINRRFISGIYPTIDSMALNYMTRYDLDPSRNNTNETFKLLCCIKTLLHYGIHVDLGTNIDRHNHKEIWNTLDDLKKLQLLQDKNFAWTIGRVDDRLYETNFPDIMMESEILAELQSKPLPDNVHAAFLKTCYNFADKMGLKLNLREHKQTHSYCWSTSSSSNVFYVDMNLKTYRCTCTVGRSRYSLFDFSYENLTNYRPVAVTCNSYAECKDCKIGGFCGGGCQLSHQIDFKKCCTYEEEVFSHFMKTLFIPYIKSKYNEVNQNERKAENRCT